MKRFHWVGSALLGALVVAACGGGESTFRVKYRFDDTFIAGIDPAQKGQVVDTQKRIIEAQQQWQKANHDAGEVQHQIRLAKGEVDVKKSQRNQAALELSVAQGGADQNRIGNATRAMKSAELGLNAAKKKLAWMQAKEDYLKFEAKYYKARVDFETAGYELAKAKVAASHNIRPKGFNLQDYQNQQAEGARYVNKVKSKSSGKRNDMLRAEQSYRQAAAAYNNSRGVRPAPATGGPGMAPVTPPIQPGPGTN